MLAKVTTSLGTGTGNVMRQFAENHHFPGVKQNDDGTIDFLLTDAEALEADLALRALKDVRVHPEVVDKLRNGTVAVALSRYAKAEVSTHCVGITEPERKANWPTIEATLEAAIASVWKSYSLRPLPVFLYHRACFLQMLGMTDDARELFVSYLKHESEFSVEDVDKSLLQYEGTNAEYAVAHAKGET